MSIHHVITPSQAKTPRLEDPRGCNDDLRERVAEVEIAEPLREHAILVEQDRDHPDQRADQEHAHGSVERHECEIVEPADQLGIAVGSHGSDRQRDAHQQHAGNRAERIDDEIRVRERAAHRHAPHRIGDERVVRRCHAGDEEHDAEADEQAVVVVVEPLHDPRWRPTRASAAAGCA